MAPIFRWQVFRANRPQATLDAEFRLLCVVGGFFFGDAEPMAGVVVGEAGEEVEVNFSDRGDDDFDIAAMQGFDKQLNDQFALLHRQMNGITLHEVFGISMALIVFPFGRWVFVVAFNVLAVMAGAEAFGVAGEPCAVRMAHAVVPVVPGTGRFLWGSHAEEFEAHRSLCQEKTQGASFLGV